jgi:antitoxin PrlF
MASGAAFELVSTLTDKYQTTVPAQVRTALKLRKRDKIAFRIAPDGETVTVTKVSDAEDDPVIGRFLRFLERDLANHPERVRQLPASLVARARALTAGVKVDLDEKLPDEDE